MLVHLLMIVLAVSPNETEFANEKVSVKVSINSNIFTYEVTNLSETPITAIQIHEHAAYDFKTPIKWQKEIKGGTFHAWTNNPTAGILPNNKAVFSMRVSSRGAILSHFPFKVQFDSEPMIDILDVWSPAPEPPSYILFIAVTTGSIFLIHTFFIYKHLKKLKGNYRLISSSEGK